MKDIAVDRHSAQCLQHGDGMGEGRAESEMREMREGGGERYST